MVIQENNSPGTHIKKKNWMEVKLGRSLSLLKGFEARILGSPAQSPVEILTTLHRMLHKNMKFHTH